jgi:hypothetical protein
MIACVFSYLRARAPKRCSIVVPDIDFGAVKPEFGHGSQGLGQMVSIVPSVCALLCR